MRKAESGIRNPRRGVLPYALLIFLCIITTTIQADEVYTKNKTGNELFKKGKYDEALKQYDDALLIAPSDSLLKMNKGSALYRSGHLQEADSLYQSVLSMKDKKKLAAARYNLGNIQFKEGDALLKSNGQGANEKYKAALDNYIAALDLQPQDKETKWNVELTQRRMKLAEQQQKQQQNQDKDQNKKDQDKKDQDKKDKKDDKKDQDKKDQDKKDQNNKDQDKKNQDQNKKDQDKKDQQNQNAQNDKQQQQKEQQQPQPKENKEDMKKEEAKRLIMQFSDDADSLNKPPKKEGAATGMHKPEKDW